MSLLIQIPTFLDNRGSLGVIQNEIGFDIKRVFYIYNVKSDQKRGGHGHFQTKLFLFSLNGECKVVVRRGNSADIFLLNGPSFGLLLAPEDWHEIYDFSPGSTLMVLASREYDKNDYFFEPLK